MRGMIAMLVDAHDDAAIGAALDRLADGGLVVLGHGHTFSGDRVDAVRQQVAARGLPMSRTLTLGVDEGARALETRVLATVQRLAASASPRHSTVPPVHSGFVALQPPVVRASEADSMPAPPLAPTLPSPEPPWPADPSWPAQAEGGSPAPVVAVRRRWPLVLAASGAAIAAVLVTVAILRGIEREHLSGADELATNDTPSASQASEPTEVEQPGAPGSGAADAIASSESVTIGEAPATATPVPTVEDAPEVVAALRKRDVRALDLVVISPEAAKAADFAGASAYCDKLVIGELDGWRLPEIGELISIARAKMVRRGAFWSATKGDAFGDLRLVLALKKERINPIGVGWNAGRVVCVRERA
jgi:hypothetical protein